MRDAGREHVTRRDARGRLSSRGWGRGGVGRRVSARQEVERKPRRRSRPVGATPAQSPGRPERGE